MSPLTRRTQILLDDERHEAVRRRAQASGVSVGALIRQAIDEMVARDVDRRAARMEAGANFLAAEPMEIGDWSEVEEAIAEGYTEEAGGGSSR